MKNRTFIFNRVLFFTLTALSISLMLTGCAGRTTQIKEKVHDIISDEPASIEEVAICEKVDENYAPVNVTNVFQPGTTIIYLSAKITDFSPEDKLRVVWNYLEVSKEIDTQELTAENSGSGYFVFNIKIAEGFPPGRYSAEVYLNDKLEEIKEFSVK